MATGGGIVCASMPPIDLTGYTEADLIDLNRRVVERIRALRQERCASAMTEFGVSDRVSFQPECGHEVVGTVIRLNRRSVTVLAPDGHQWRVAPGLLKKASSEHGSGDPSSDGALHRMLLHLAAGQPRDRGKA
jgi:hypothetical protein